MSEIAWTARERERDASRESEDGCRSISLLAGSRGDFEHAACAASLTWQPILVHTYVYTYVHARVKGAYTTGHIDPQHAYVSSMSNRYRKRGGWRRCGALSHRNTGVANADSGGKMRRSCFILFWRAYSRFMFQRYNISSRAAESVSPDYLVEIMRIVKINFDDT